MSYKNVIHGLYAPLVTPFHADESIDFEGYKKIIDYVIDGGMDGVLVGGTTGEYHMMSLEERKELIRRGCEIVNGRVPVIAGTGMPTAKATVELTNWSCLPTTTSPRKRASMSSSGKWPRAPRSASSSTTPPVPPTWSSLRN